MSRIELKKLGQSVAALYQGQGFEHRNPQLMCTASSTEQEDGVHRPGPHVLLASSR
jgi:hypothetical protein